MMTDPRPCIRCGCDLNGPPLDDGLPSRREVGIEVRGAYDGVIAWQCPECGLAWPRFLPDHYLAAKSAEWASEITLANDRQKKDAAEEGDQ